MKKQLIQLSDHFDTKRILRFSLSPICTMIFASLYGIVDGFFVSNYVGSTAFASLNLVMPMIMLICGVGFMFGTGGCALVAKHLGMKERDKANRYFSMIVTTMLTIGIFLSIIGYIFSPQASRFMGATDEMLPYCIAYLRINMIGEIFFMLQQFFQSFLITAEKPKLGLGIMLMTGCTNMLLDWLFVGVLGFGLEGAAWATITAQAVGGIIPLVLFIIKKDWNIHLVKARIEIPIIAKACGNGISEFLSSISASIVGFVFNLQLLRYAGENGVAAFGVIMYVSFIFIAIYIGFTMGISPVISYHDGAKNTNELKSLYRKCLYIIGISNLCLTLLSEICSVPLSKLFVGYEPALYQMTVQGMRIYSICFLVLGFNIFASAFFTALNNGKVSAILSVSRSLVFDLAMTFIMPMLLGTNGLWAATIASEILGLILTIVCFIKYGKRYGYR